MKITNIEEFEKTLDFICSTTFLNLKMSDQNKIKDEFIVAAREMCGAHEVMKKELLNEFKTGYRGFGGDKEKVLYIFRMLSEEERIQILSDYLNGKIKDKSYRFETMRVYPNVLLPMLDFLSEEHKVKVFCEVNIKKLLEIMYRLDIEFNGKYYNICKKALEMSSEEEKIQVLLECLNKENGYMKEYLDVLLTIADSLSQEPKIRFFSKIDNEKLFEVMAELNIKFNKATFFNKKRKYYKKYYDICKKALEMKDLR